MLFKNKKKQAIIIAGMHRSGTSLTSRLCNVLGVTLDKNLAAAPPEDNESGYWEPEDAINLHEAVFAHFGLRSDDIDIFPIGWEEAEDMLPFRNRLKSWLIDSFSNSALWSVKDPRICRMLPLWLPVLAEMEVEPVFILAYRNPLEVASSLSKRGGPDEYADQQKLLLWWLEHVLEAEKFSRGFKRTFVYYPDILTDWKTAMKKVAEELGIKWPKKIFTVAKEVNQFINPKLYRNRTDDVSALKEQDSTGWIEQVYTILHRANKTGQVNTTALDNIYYQLVRKINGHF